MKLGSHGLGRVELPVHGPSTASRVRRIHTPDAVYRLILESHQWRVPGSLAYGCQALGIEAHHRVTHPAALGFVQNDRAPVFCTDISRPSQIWGQFAIAIGQALAGAALVGTSRPSLTTAVAGAALVVPMCATLVAGAIAGTDSEQHSKTAAVRNFLTVAWTRSNPQVTLYLVTLRDLLMAQKLSTVARRIAMESGREQPEIGQVVGMLHEPGLARALQMTEEQRLRKIGRILSLPVPDHGELIRRARTINRFDWVGGRWVKTGLEDPGIAKVLGTG